MTAIDAGPTLDEIRGWPATVGVPAAARAIGVSPSWAYQLIAQDQWPTRLIKIGARSRVLTASLVALLESGQPVSGSE